ncbi:hydroxyacid dehydrogenase [Mesorhizobium cantuariense]|uniref:Hydroxyacid dehydrogenase n=1 Tax=Mesorhizobium cantuariense TaxID=1300275 RepID=A0ABV7MJI4_9HYPH
MPTKPTLSIALNPELAPDLISTEHLLRLANSCEVLSSEPLTGLSSPDEQQRLAASDILLTGWGAPRLDAAVLAAAPRLRLIAHAASSVKAFVAPEAWDLGITVVSAAAANAVPVAEFALAAILLANKGVFVAQARFARERAFWLPQWMAPGEPGNLGATIGIVGASRTGRKLLELLKPFNLEALVYDPFLTNEEAHGLGAAKVSLAELLRRSRSVCVQAPALPETFHMIGREELRLMPDGATLINTARGTLVDHAALEAELLSGRLNAVLDVTDPEPLPAQSPLYDLPNVFLTPHVAGAVGDETRRMTYLVIEEIERFVAGQPLHHAVTRQMLASIG